MRSPEHIGKRWEAWLLSKDPLAEKVVELFSNSNDSLQSKVDLAAAAFAAGYVARVQDETQEASCDECRQRIN